MKLMLGSTGTLGWLEMLEGQQEGETFAAVGVDTGAAGVGSTCTRASCYCKFLMRSIRVVNWAQETIDDYFGAVGLEGLTTLVSICIRVVFSMSGRGFEEVATL
ncbi:hypothetical protein ACLOJK_032457 [Asimina triloba]